MKWCMLIPLIIVLSFVLLVACDNLEPPVLSVTPVDLSTVTSL